MFASRHSRAAALLLVAALVAGPGAAVAAGPKVTELLSKLKFKARPDLDQVRFQAILSQTLLALDVLLLVTALFVAAVYNRLLVRPLRRLSGDIDAMQQGRFTHNPASQQPMHILELENIRHSLYDYQLELHELHGSLEHQNPEFHSQARQDALTGCYNRRAYDEDWQRLREEMKANPQGVAFLLFDCDRFKAINDTFGHGSRCARAAGRPGGTARAAASRRPAHPTRPAPAAAPAAARCERSPAGSGRGARHPGGRSSGRFARREPRIPSGPNPAASARTPPTAAR